MSYDWHGEIGSERFTREWFDTIDARFRTSARLFATETRPFDRILRLSELAGRDVLEIGCGREASYRDPRSRRRQRHRGRPEDDGRE
jgi:hypothetical protein